jgi:thiamine biosynthesis lipoprotein
VLTTALSLPGSAPSNLTASPGQLRFLRWSALGTRCEIQYVCADAVIARAFEREVVGWVEAFEAKYSRFRPDSLISGINAAAGQGWVAIDSEMEQFLELSGSLFQLSQGVLDVTALPLMLLWDYRAATPRIPSEAEIAAAKRLVGWSKVQRAPGRVRLPEAGMALDFGGWGKEYAVDLAAQIARKHGIAHALVDFGHDLFALGAAPGKPAWHVGLEDPARPGEACWGSIAARDCGVASSGDYMRGFTLGGKRYGHIVDPRTGWPVANGCRQVNVVARACVQAGALATTVFILGPEIGLRLVQDLMGAEACVRTDRELHQTKGFYKYVVTK